MKDTTTRRAAAALRRSAQVESLEGRRLLSGLPAYPLLDLPGPATGNTERVSSSGEAFLHAFGRLFRSDGSGAGTVPLGTGIGPFFDWSGTVVFGAAPDFGDSAAYKIEPGSSVPVELRDAAGARLPRPGAFVSVGSKLYFSATASARPSSVYVSDGTSAGTSLVRPGVPIGRAGDALVFTSGSQLWRTDGTTAGTVMIRDAFSARPGLGQDLGGAVLFGGPGGLWKSDGTAAGTVLVKSGINGIREWRRIGDAAYFMDAPSGTTGTLWKTDGTDAGTVSLGPIYSGVGLPYPVGPSMTHVGSTLYYVAAPAGQTAQVWATEGPGTSRRITNLGAPPSGGVIPGLVAVDDKVLFAARTSGVDFELWETNGVVGNAARVPGFVTERGGSSEYGPVNLLPVGGSLFYTQRMFGGPTRLWRYGVSPAVLDAQGLLVVTGTDPAEGVPGNDQIALSGASDTLTATVNGVARSFPLAGVRRIVVNGLGGDDAVTAEGVSALPLIFNGSDGQDSLTWLGTAGEDVVSFTSSPNFGPGGAVHVSAVESLSVDTLAGNDRVTLTSLKSVAVLHAGAGEDVLVIDDAARSTDEDYTLSGTAFGRSTTAGGLITPLLTYDGAEAVTLRAGSGANVITVTPGETVAFTVEGNDPAPPAARRDRLSVVTTGATGTRNEPAITAGAGQWTFTNRRAISYSGIEQTDDGDPLLGDFVDVTPDPRRAPVPDVRIVFSEPVTGFDRSDLRLTRSGSADNLLTDQQTLVGADGVSWTLGNLAGLTTPDGQYTLTIVAAGSDIRDAVGSPLAEDGSESFTVDNVLPVADIQDVSPDPRTEPVDVVRIVFSEPVVGFTAAHLDLTRDGGADLLTAAQTLTQLNDTTYSIANLAPLTRAAGEYVLRLDPSTAGPLTDRAGNPVASVADIWRMQAMVRGRSIFYNGSPRDGGDGAADARDDEAIAPDKQALLPGQTASFANYTGYDRGINGVMIDITGLARALTAADFTFRAGNSDNPAAWPAAPAPQSVTLRTGAGVGGADRVTFTWADYSIRNRWLQVQLTAPIGLPGGDSFYFGNLGGETGNLPRGIGGTVDPGDFNATRNHLSLTGLPLSYRWDHNRDGRVNYVDLAVVRRNLRQPPLRLLNAPGASVPPAEAATDAAGAAARELSRPAGRTDFNDAPAPVLAQLRSRLAAATPNRGSDVAGFVEIGRVIYFAADDGIHGVEPWTTDGTPEGTVMVADINPGPLGSMPQRFSEVRGVAVFAANDGIHGEEPWRTDGTAGGTFLLEDVNPGAEGSSFGIRSNYDGSRRRIVIGGVMYFTANRAGEGFELWRTDGTPFGTYLVRDLLPGPAGSFPEGMNELNGQLIFSARWGSSPALWRSSGNAAGTVPVGGDTAGGPAFMTLSGGNIYFSFSSYTDTRLRKTDGTSWGTSIVTDLAGEISEMVDVNGALFMRVRSFAGVGGYYLYKSDGTAAGTARVGDESGPGAASNPMKLTSYNGAVYFTATNDAAGWELWRSDGTAAGTRVLKDIQPGPGGSFPQWAALDGILPLSSAVIDGMLYFTALEAGVGRQIWRSDGTEAGTVRLTSVPGGVTEYATFAKKGAYVYFGAGRADVGFELWRSDGTPEGTALFKDINQVPINPPPVAAVASLQSRIDPLPGAARPPLRRPMRTWSESDAMLLG